MKLNKVLYGILWALAYITVLVLVFFWGANITHRYDNKVFYISQEGEMPELDNTTFVKNEDGTYTAKLYGVFPMGTCYLYYTERPTVTIANLGMYIQPTSVGSVKIKSFSFENSPAEQAGIQVGDYIYSCNDFIIGNGNWNLSGAVSYIRPNKLVVIRDGEFLTYYVETNEDNLMGIYYGPSNAILGTVCFLDDDYLWGVGHNTNIDIVGAKGTYVLFDEGEEGIDPVKSAKDLGYTIVSSTEYGVLAEITKDFDFLSGREVELAWSWEIDYNKPATVELALTEGSIEDVQELTDTEKREVSVTIQPFNGVIEDLEGNKGVQYNYCIKADGFKFLNGMSGSPVFQNDRLIGVLTAVNVEDQSTAFILSAEDAYTQFLLEKQAASFGDEVIIDSYTH